MQRFFKIVVISVLVAFPGLVDAQSGGQPIESKTNYTPEIEARIRLVEESTGLNRYVIEGVKQPSLQDRMAQYHINGITVAVINDYKVEWVKGYGWADVKEKRPVTPETLFEPGSISKSLNAVGVLKLVQDKRLDLFTDINQYLVSWKFPYDSVAKGKKITIANLLSHTAGLSVHGFPGFFYRENKPTLQQILDGKKPAKTRAVRSLFEPGLKFQYSGGGTMISQQILIDVTGKPYDTYIAETVFKPIGMDHSFFTQPPPPDKRSMLATAYQQNGTKKVSGNYPLLLEQAAGGLWTTPSDLAKFIIEIQLSAQGRSNKVLTKETTQLMLTPYIDRSAALGVFIEEPLPGVKYFQHSAGNLGFCGQYYGSLQDGKGVVIFMNADYGYQLMNEFVNTVAFVYKWKGMYDEKAPVVVKQQKPSHELLVGYGGLYREDNGTYALISEDGEDFNYRSGGSGPWKMYFTSNMDFVNLESKSEKRFENTAGGVPVLKRSLDGKLLSTATRLPTIKVTTQMLERYPGKYRSETGENGKIVSKDGLLWFDDGESMQLYFTGEKEFVILPQAGTVYHVDTDQSGNVVSIAAMKGEERVVFKKIK